MFFSFFLLKKKKMENREGVCEEQGEKQSETRSGSRYGGRWDHPDKKKWLIVLILRRHEGTRLALFQTVLACRSLRYHQNDLKETHAWKSFWWQLHNLLSVQQGSLQLPNKQFQVIVHREFILTCFYFMGSFQVLHTNYKGTNVSHQAHRRRNWA